MTIAHLFYFIFNTCPPKRKNARESIWSLPRFDVETIAAPGHCRAWSLPRLVIAAPGHCRASMWRPSPRLVIAAPGHCRASMWRPSPRLVIAAQINRPPRYQARRAVYFENECTFCATKRHTPIGTALENDYTFYVARVCFWHFIFPKTDIKKADLHHRVILSQSRAKHTENTGGRIALCKNYQTAKDK